MQLQSKHDSATSFVDAGNAYKKADPQGKGSDVPHCLGGQAGAFGSRCLRGATRKVLLLLQNGLPDG